MLQLAEPERALVRQVAVGEHEREIGAVTANSSVS